MARTVDTTSTFEDWRQKYNDLANDVGGLSNLRTANKASIVDAVNYIQDQYFFFQDFDFDGCRWSDIKYSFHRYRQRGCLHYHTLQVKF